MKMNKVNQEIYKKEWKEKIIECRSSGLSVSNWCELNSISKPTYYYWLKKIRTEICEAIKEETPVSLVPLVVEKENVQPNETDKSAVAVLIRGDVRIELSNSISEDLLAAILGNL